MITEYTYNVYNIVNVLFQIVIDSLVLRVNVYYLHAPIYKDLVNHLNEKECFVYFTRSVLQYKALEIGLKSYDIQVAFKEAPIAVYFFITDTAAITGQFNKHPFMFKHLNIQRAYIKLRGEKYPSEEMTGMTWDDNDLENCVVDDAYFKFMETCGAMWTDRDIDMDMVRWIKGVRKFVFIIFYKLSNVNWLCCCYSRRYSVFNCHRCLRVTIICRRLCRVTRRCIWSSKKR